jgi:small conductance mechanosensitive channel
MARARRGTPVLAGILSLLLLPANIHGQEEAPSDSALPPQVSEIRGELDGVAQGDLFALFQRIPGLEEVELRVEAGVVFLSGTVLSGENRELAESLARAEPGVLHVENRIREETSLRSRLGPMRARVEEKLLVGIAYLPLLILAALVAGAFLFLGGAVSRWDAPYRRMAANPFLRTLLSQLVGGMVGLVGVLLALELLDATALVGAVLGAAGVAGVAVGFAFRNIAENYLAGILLSVRQPFAPDDHIHVEGQEGKVIRLTSRETILMTLDGNHVRIPNATIFNSVIVNYTRNPLRRFQFDLSVGQGENPGQVQEIGVNALRGIEGILEEPAPRSTIVEVGDSWVLLRFFGWTDQSRTGFDKVRSEGIRLTKAALDGAGVAMPAPEYGLRILEDALGSGGATDTGRFLPAPVPVPAPKPDLGPDRIGAGERGPSPELQPDLSPDRELMEQIARDREKAGERDLLDPASERES